MVSMWGYSNVCGAPIRNGKVESDSVSVQSFMWGLARAQLTNPGRGRAGFGCMPLFPHLPQ